MVVQSLLLGHRLRAQGVQHDVWTAGSRWVRWELRIARAHRFQLLQGWVDEALACSAALAAGRGCRLLGPGCEAGGVRACRLPPALEVLLSSRAACPARP
jgi:hypothetical protein